MISKDALIMKMNQWQNTGHRILIKRITFSAAGYASPRYRVVIGDHSLLVF